MANPDPHPTPAENTSDTSRIVEGRELDPVIYEGDIDDRMAHLLKDHQEMGARPKQEPTTEDAPAAAAEAPAPTKRKAKSKK